jgi:hypothetical protein
MPVPVAFPLASFLARAGITALGTGAATEGIKSLQNQGVVNPNMAQQALMRTIMGPTSESNKTKSNTWNSSTRTTTTRNYRITYTRTATRNYRITYTRESTSITWND